MSAEKISLPNRIGNFLKESKSELKKIVWPDRKKVTKNTVIVISGMVICGLLIALVDLGLNQAFGFLIRLFE